MSELRPPIYLDHHATTPVDPLVVEAMLPWFTERFGNASSVNHRFGEEAREAVDAAREHVAGAIGAESRSIVFTSGATESNNLALKGVLRAAGGGHLVVNAAEHRAVLDPAGRLAKEDFAVDVLPVDRFARVDPDAVREALRPETRLVSVMLANNEVGTINPVAEIAKVCRERGVLLHCDAAQAVGRIPVDVESLGADLLSFTAHKLYGPKGVGALYVRRGAPRIRLVPLLDGGAQEWHLRSGTVPVPLVVGFGRACELAASRRDEDFPRIARLRDDLEGRLRLHVPELRVNGDPENRLPGNLSVAIPGVDGDALIVGLTRIAVSSGSACSTSVPEPSHVLRSMGHSDADARSSLRIGIGRGNHADEISVAAEHIVDVVERLRANASAD